MAQPFDHIPEEIKRAALDDSAPKDKAAKETAPRQDPPTATEEPAAPDKPEKGRKKREIPPDRKQRRLIKYRRANVELTEAEVREIKAGRKKLRRDMKKQRIYNKKDFELVASGLGLYFDKNRLLPFLGWLFHGKGLLALLGALGLLLFALAVLSWAVQMRGHFTINLSDDLMKEGFVLSETADFAFPTTRLFSQPADDVPCVSISDIPEDIDETDGSHNEDYFAYTYYIRNEGENAVDYAWQVTLNSESLDLSKAAWVMVFEDGEMSFYAKPSSDGTVEALPSFDDSRHGYIEPVLRQFLADESQYELVKQVGSVGYYRAVPKNFVSDAIIAEDTRTNMAPGSIHKYTVVIWLEGDDPDCTDELIGGHLGLEMDFRLLNEDGEETNVSWWSNFLGGLKWWQD